MFAINVSLSEGDLGCTSASFHDLVELIGSSVLVIASHVLDPGAVLNDGVPRNRCFLSRIFSSASAAVTMSSNG